MCFEPPMTITVTQKASSEDSVEFSLSASIAVVEPTVGGLSPEEFFSAVCLSLYAGVQAACVARLQQIADEQRRTPWELN